MIYYKLHEKGYKFCEKVQDLTRPQIAYLGKAMEVEAENRNNEQTKNETGIDKQSLKDKYNDRVNKGGGK